MAKFQGANKLGIRSGALAAIEIGVARSEVFNADNANAGAVARIWSTALSLRLGLKTLPGVTTTPS